MGNLIRPGVAFLSSILTEAFDPFLSIRNDTQLDWSGYNFYIINPVSYIIQNQVKFNQIAV